MFWTREVVGWGLIGLGLLIFGATYSLLLLNGRIFESVPAAFMGFIIFRGGIHLVKVAVAARICQQAAAAPKPKAVHPVVPQRALPGQQPRLMVVPVLPAEAEENGPRR
jgi:hypothetical protein